MRKKINIKKIICAALVATMALTVKTSTVKADTVYNGKVYKIMSLSTRKYVDVCNNSSANGTNIQVWSANSSNAQRFYIKKVSGQWYRIQSLNGKVLDVTGGTAASGVNVQLYEWNGTGAQLWQFLRNANGAYRIQNKLGYYLDVNGSNIQVYKSQSYGTDRQRFGIYQMSNTNPYAYLDSITATGSRCVKVAAWAFDWDCTEKSLTCRVAIQKKGSKAISYSSCQANSSRPDVNAVYAGVGKSHGLSSSIKLPSKGYYTITLQVLDGNAGTWHRVGSKYLYVR